MASCLSSARAWPRHAEPGYGPGVPSASAHPRHPSSAASSPASTSAPSVTAAPPRLGRRASAVVVVLLALATTVLGLALATAAGIVTAAPASAHDRLLSSDPADGAALDEPPAAVTLTFSGEVLETGTQVVVTGDDGQVAGGTVAVDGDVVTASLPADLAGGAYTVTWRVVSADGHPIEGTFGFDVAEQAASSTPSSEQSEPATPTPTDEAEPTTEPSPTQGATPGDGGGRSAWVLGAALLAAAAVGTAAVVRNRRQLGGHGPAGQD